MIGYKNYSDFFAMQTLKNGETKLSGSEKRNFWMDYSVNPLEVWVKYSLDSTAVKT